MALNESSGEEGSGSKAVLVVGIGNVGAGIAEAFVHAGWQVTAVDPSAALMPDILYCAPHFVCCSRIEDLPDAQLRDCLARCSAVVYAADCGNRDAYDAPDGDALIVESLQRFDTFARRVSAARPYFHISYVGGSWTRREPLVDPDGVPFIEDSSPAKRTEACNPYELAKCRAHDAAEELSSVLELPITFYDWASVVPNLAPNFTVSRMTVAALAEGCVEFSGGDYGRPLLHRADAGRCLVAVTEVRLRSPEAARPFDVVLLHGAFTPFASFAEVVCEVVAETGREISRRERGGETPHALRNRCSSARLLALGIEADAEAVKRGLREGCMASLASALRGV